GCVPMLLPTIRASIGSISASRPLGEYAVEIGAPKLKVGNNCERSCVLSINALQYDIASCVTPICCDDRNVAMPVVTGSAWNTRLYVTFTEAVVVGTPVNRDIVALTCAKSRMPTSGPRATSGGGAGIAGAGSVTTFVSLPSCSNVKKNSSVA